MNENNQTQSKGTQRGRPTRSLIGKVVLLVGGDTAVLNSLVAPLAERGADIALISSDEGLHNVGSMRDSVESAGRRFLHIDDEARREESADALIDSVTDRLGHLDIFIDLSQSSRGSSQLLPNWQLAQAALSEMSRV